MNKLTTFLMGVASLVANSVVAATYASEATMALQKDEGIYNVVVRVSQLIEQDGKLVEQLISQPRIKSAPSVPATAFVGLQPSDPNFVNGENVTVDVSWPYPNESGTALCAVTIKREDTIVSKSRLQLQIQGPGRTPFIVTPQEINPKSVQVVDERSKTFVLLEFTGKTKEAAKILANENYGNKFYIRDSQGAVTEGGLSSGTYNEVGMAVQYETKDEADRAARILRGENLK